MKKYESQKLFLKNEIHDRVEFFAERRNTICLKTVLLVLKEGGGGHIAHIAHPYRRNKDIFCNNVFISLGEKIMLKGIPLTFKLAQINSTCLCIFITSNLHIIIFYKKKSKLLTFLCFLL